MPAYVPPHMRNKPAESDSAPAERDSKQAADKGSGDKPGRFDDLGDDDRAPPAQDRSKGQGKGKSQGDRSSKPVSAFAAGAGGDWRNRQDGRRGNAQGPTELEVFGEIKTRSTAGIDFDKYDAIPVQITGNDVEGIVPISRFSEGKLSESLFDNLRRCGYDRPTPVQRHSIPIVVAGRDLMACAQTGSGKTCAFMVPCLESLLRSGPPAGQGGNRRPTPSPCGLVLAPTRELAAQIHAESLKFSYETGIRACIIYGGADMREQQDDMKRGCDILVATPGRLTDMIDRRYVTLELIQFFILDEADRMLDMGFEPQVRQIVSSGLGSHSQFPRQNMMFSATFAREVQVMAQDFLKDYVFITVGRVGSASDLITQSVVYAEDVKQKVRELERAIKNEKNMPPGGLAVIFVETKRAADTLELDLHEAGVKVTAIHGDRSQTERESALHAFKTGANPVLVATDVAARGLDIPNVSLVVNFDMPKQLDDYVHRIGRTGRAGRKGTAIAFVNERCTYLTELGDVLLEAKQDLPCWFSDLVNSAARRAGPGKTKSRFGDTDLRVEEAKKNGTALPGVATPLRAGNAPARDPGAWGQSGADDSW